MLYESMEVNLGCDVALSAAFDSCAVAGEYVSELLDFFGFEVTPCESQCFPGAVYLKVYEESVVGLWCHVAF